MYLKQKSSILPLFAFNLTASVKHAHLIIQSKCLPIQFQIPLVSISYIEAKDGNLMCNNKLNIRGQNFQLIMWGINVDWIDELQEWLRFLVTRQRIPHSILGLPFDWELKHAKNRKSKIKIKLCWPK